MYVCMYACIHVRMYMSLYVSFDSNAEQILADRGDKLQHVCIYVFVDVYCILGMNECVNSHMLARIVTFYGIFNARDINCTVT
jgi:hypothetical protein